MEGRAGVAEALLASAESAEVLSGLGDNIIVEVEVDAAGLLCWGGVLMLAPTSLRGCGRSEIFGQQPARSLN